ncbi:hypothetical protein RJ641_003098 [Dillenia turbinata]|uniref:Uncharacterized protein n=1 Tax=Dillenia turbinata TaxID=194707 RepID=A0AAN8ZDW8_9MAGN
MVSASLWPQSYTALQISTVSNKSSGRGTDARPQKLIRIGFTVELKPSTNSFIFCSSSSSPLLIPSHKSVPLAASIAILLWSTPDLHAVLTGRVEGPQLMMLLLSIFAANAGFLSGFSGIESVPGPQLPEIDFLTRFNEENQKKYEEFDKRFQSSPLLKELLERSKMNKEKNRQAIQDKYCVRGAEWGVGDCSTDGMSAEERENFIAMLKQKAGITE